MRRLPEHREPQPLVKLPRLRGYVTLCHTGMMHDMSMSSTTISSSPTVNNSMPDVPNDMTYIESHLPDLSISGHPNFRRHDPEYYFADGSVVVLVQDVLFRVKSYV